MRLILLPVCKYMSLKEKQIIRDTAIESLGYDEGERVWTSKIVW